MSKAFISYSSAYRDLAAGIVSRLNPHITIDYQSFEPGQSIEDQIVLHLNGSDLFVILLSNEALDSKWVQSELDIIQSLINADTRKSFIPFIVDIAVNHDDTRIPDWVRQHIISKTRTPGKISELIKRRLLELSWNKHPKLKQRSQLFVGRNDSIKKFEERIDDILAPYPYIHIVSGLPGIGKKTFARHCIVKANLTSTPGYYPPVVALEKNESIEDLIIKINDLGFSSDLDVSNLSGNSIEHKLNLLIRLVRDLVSSNVISTIEDNGCIIRPNRFVSPWFLKFIDLIDGHPELHRLIFSIASRYSPSDNFLISQDHVLYTQLHGLTRKERTGLISRLCRIEELSLSTEDINQANDYLDGTPAQIHYLVSTITKHGIRHLRNNPSFVTDFQQAIYKEISDRILSDSLGKRIVGLLADAEFFNVSQIFQLFGDGQPTLIADFIDLLDGESVIEYIGVNREFIKLNQGLRVYLRRTGIHVDNEDKLLLKNNLLDSINSGEEPIENLSNFLYSMKNLLMDNHNIANKYILPSHYLNAMIDLYETQRKYTEVVRLADRILENEHRLDRAIAEEIHYWLCLGLARLRDERTLKEINYFEGSDYHFLNGFYSRMTGDYDRALRSYDDALAQRPNFPRAKREKVQVLLNLELYEDALSLARENYEGDSDNPFHIQSYFNSVLHSKHAFHEKPLLRDLLNQLRQMGTDRAADIAAVCESNFELIINRDSKRAIDIIRSRNNPNSPFMLEREFNIYERLDDRDKMNKVIKRFESQNFEFGTNEYNMLLIMKAKYHAHRGEKGKALNILENDLKFYPQRPKQNLRQYIEDICAK